MIQAVIQILVNNSGVQSAVGLNKKGDRYKIFPVAADQDEKPPYSVASITGNQPNYCKDGASRLDRVSFRVVHYDDSYERVNAIDNAVRFALDGYNGTSASIPISIWFTGQQDLFLEEGKNYYARVSDYQAHVTRTP